jgi:hypothetical protein
MLEFVLGSVLSTLECLRTPAILISYVLLYHVNIQTHEHHNIVQP